MVTIDDAMEMKMEFTEEGTSPLLIPVCIINPDLDLVSFIRVIQPASNNRLDHHLGLHGTTGLFLQQLGPHHHALIHLNLGSGQDHLPSRLTFWAHALHLISKPNLFLPEPSSSYAPTDISDALHSLSISSSTYQWYMDTGATYAM